MEDDLAVARSDVDEGRVAAEVVRRVDLAAAQRVEGREHARSQDAEEADEFVRRHQRGLAVALRARRVPPGREAAIVRDQPIRRRRRPHLNLLLLPVEFRLSAHQLRLLGVVVELLAPAPRRARLPGLIALAQPALGARRAAEERLVGIDAVGRRQPPVEVR